MPQILVRNVAAPLKASIQRRARRNGRSMEAEVREMLSSVIKQDENAPEVGFGTATAALFRGCGLQKGEEFRELRGFKIEPIHFDE